MIDNAGPDSFINAGSPRLLKDADWHYPTARWANTARELMNAFHCHGYPGQETNGGGPF